MTSTRLARAASTTRKWISEPSGASASGTADLSRRNRVRHLAFEPAGAHPRQVWHSAGVRPGARHLTRTESRVTLTKGEGKPRRPERTTRGRHQGDPNVIGAEVSAERSSTWGPGSLPVPILPPLGSAGQHSAGSNTVAARWIVARPTRTIGATHAKPPRLPDKSKA